MLKIDDEAEGLPASEGWDVKGWVIAVLLALLLMALVALVAQSEALGYARGAAAGYREICMAGRTP